MNFMKLVTHKLNSHPRQANYRRRERGMNIAPMLLGLAIFSMVALSVFGIFRYVSGFYTTYVENSNLTSIVSAGKSLQLGGSYTDVDNAALQRLQAFGNMSGGKPGGTPRNGWGGTVVVTGSNNELSIRYNDVPSSSCDSFRVRALNSGEFASITPAVCASDATTSFTFTVY